MDHIWTYDARKREGQIPLLPESSRVVFDEGHLVEYALKSFNIPFKANDDGATINEIATKRYS